MGVLSCQSRTDTHGWNHYRAQPQGDSHGDTRVSPQAGHRTRLSCPSSCKHLSIHGFHRKPLQPPPPHQSLPGQRAAYLCLSHLRHGFFSSRARVKVSLSPLSPTLCVSGCRGGCAQPLAELRAPRLCQHPRPWHGPNLPVMSPEITGFQPKTLSLSSPTPRLHYLQPTHPHGPGKGRRHNNCY